MRATIPLLTLLAFVCLSFVADQKPTTVHEFTVNDILGNKVKLSKFEGKVLLIVNVASKCGLSPQYEDLQKIYDDYNEQGLIVLGFPANNFGNQEPGSNDEIHRFCTQKYGVTFPMFSKISVKGDEIHPLYEYLTQKELNGVEDAPVLWNFQKFIINAKGELVKSLHPKTRVTEDDVVSLIEEELEAAKNPDSKKTKKKKGKKTKKAKKK